MIEIAVLIIAIAFVVLVLGILFVLKKYQKRLRKPSKLLKY